MRRDSRMKSFEISSLNNIGINIGINLDKMQLNYLYTAFYVLNQLSELNLLGNIKHN